jgi:hypothetical protein
MKKLSLDALKKRAEAVASEELLSSVVGGMQWRGRRQSNNVIDRRVDPTNYWPDTPLPYQFY